MSGDKHFWLGRPIFDPAHAVDLERAAAIHEFAGGLDRAAAEEAAHTEYRTRYHTEAAAHHLAGMRRALTRNPEAAGQHANMYALHMQALGAGEAAVTPEVQEALNNYKDTGSYEYQSHGADEYLGYEPV